jgi:glycosyltransferase involved in cell wall biosynthesis
VAPATSSTLPDLVVEPAITTATMVILIPAYEPDHKLVDLVRSIRSADQRQTIVIVDDGSGPQYDAVFRAARMWGCDVTGHVPNRGKGHALKRGFEHIARRYPGADVVCADCDGQHSLTDIRRVADAIRSHRDEMVLGARQFVGDVPSRSRFGNDLTRAVFQLTTGLRLQDTQTGLRGYPATMLPWLQTVSGERFEYELNALLEAKRAGIGFHEVPIETIYLDGNESSHFRAVRDSVRVYLPFVKFSLSSFTAFTVDFVLFLAFMGLTGWLLASVVFARVISASLNFLANHRYVFSRRDVLRRSAAGPYAALVVTLLAANYGILRLLTRTVGLGLVPAKLLTEATLFVLSYQL